MPAYPTIGDARSAGLFHPNCGHTLDTFTPGTEKLLGVQPTGPSQAEFERQRLAYAQSQQQRALERKVRDAKRQKAAAITPEAQHKADRQIKGAQADLRAHTAGTGRPRQYPREKPREGAQAPEARKAQQLVAKAQASEPAVTRDLQAIVDRSGGDLN